MPLSSAVRSTDSDPLRRIPAVNCWAIISRPLKRGLAERPLVYLSITTRVGSGEIDGRLDGRFLVDLARCEVARTGKILDTEAGGNPDQAWPSSPLSLRGSFQGLPPGRR